MKTKIIVAVILVCFSLGSFFFLGNVASNPQNHKASIKVLDEKKANVLKLTALTTASSTAISMIPGDTATPISNKLADLTSWFLLVLCAIFLEKYLLTITGLLAFKILIPMSLLFLIVWIFYPKDFLIKLAMKLGLFGVCLFITIPISVKITNIIDNTYDTSLQTIINDAESTNTEIENESIKEAEEQADRTEEENNSQGWFDKGKELVGNAIDSAQEMVGNVLTWGSDKIKEFTVKAEKTLNNFIEATAVMLITSCVIPLLVIMFFIWLVKVILGINIDVGKIRASLKEKTDKIQAKGIEKKNSL